MDYTECTTANHPVTGETFAVGLDDGEIVIAAGPLHHDESRASDDLGDYLGNQSAGDLADDAEWLRAAIDSCPWCAEPVDPTDGFFCYQCKP